MVWEDHFYPEIIDPDTGAVLPDGEEGELVFTTLTKEALPVIRYRTRDLTRLLPPTARSMRRMGKIVGRSDDMLIIRGVNLFPTQIEEIVLGARPALGAVPARRHARRQPRRGRGALRGAAAARRGGPRPRSPRRCAHRIKTLIGITTTVDVGAPDSLERTLVGKAKRVVDKRAEIGRTRDVHASDGHDGQGPRRRAEGGPLGRRGRAPGARSTRASTPATSSRPRTGCPITTARRWCARSASTRTPRSSACCPRATGSAARRP